MLVLASGTARSTRSSACVIATRLRLPLDLSYLVAHNLKCELAASGAIELIERIDLTSATAQASFRDASSASGSTALATHAYGKGQTTLFAFDLASSAAAGDKVGYGGVR
jgi:hypothetical protein